MHSLRFGTFRFRFSALTRHFSVTRFLVLAWFVLATAGVSFSQSDRGTLAGTVLDSSGAAIQGATITATSVDTGTLYTATSGPTGGFRIPDVRIGAYNVSATSPNFKTAEQTGVIIQINTTANVEFQLQPGDVKETLTVVGNAPSIQAESSDIGTIVDKKEIEELPLSINATGQSFLRSAESFVFLAPGTAGPGTNSDHSSSGIFESKLAGGQNFSTEVILDGASTTRADSGSAFDQTAPSVEALSEFKVFTSTIPGEFGRTSGGVESFATKSGTNSFHGTAFDLLRNDKLDANSWDNDFNHQPKPRDHQNNFGGSLGGPVRIPKLYNGRDKTFFFFSWEQYRNNQGTSSLTTLPSVKERSGDFSEILGADTGLLNPCDNSHVLLGQIFDPSTTKTVTVGGQQVQCRTAFPGNKITAPLSTVAQNILKLVPLPNNPSGSGGCKPAICNNFLFNSNKPIRDTTMTFRIDQNWGVKNKFFFSYSSRDQEVLNANMPALPPPLDPNFFNSNFTHYLRFGWDYTLSSNLLNHITIGFNRLNNFSKGESVTGVDWDQVLGIKNASGPVFPPIQFTATATNIAYQNLSAANDDGNIPNSLVVAESVSWIKGRHSFRFGFDWRSYQFSRKTQANQSPTYSFFGLQTAFTPNNSQSGDPLASFLIGAPQEESLQVASVFPRWASNYYAGYVQDDYKILKNLTLNLGFRYDVDTPRHEAHNAESVLDLAALNTGDPAPGVPISPGIPGALIYGAGASGAKTYFKDVAPRVGFAYAPDRLFHRFKQTVLRGGYSIYYAAITYSDFGNSLTSGTTATPDFKTTDNFSAAQSPDSGFPSYAPPSNNRDPALLNGQPGINYVAASYGRPAMVQNWSLEVQHQLATDLILSVGYIGMHSTHLHSNLAQLDSIDPTFFRLGTQLNNAVTSAAGRATLASLGVSVPSWFVPLYGPSNDTVGQLLLPFPQYQSINSSCCLENLGQSTYNALQAKLERRFRNGLNLLASYTFSKTLTDADSTFPVFTGFNSNVFGAQNPRNLKAEKSVSYQDVPHAFVLSYLYELPAGPGKKYLSHGPASKVLGGWEVGGVHRYQTGSPFLLNAFATSPPFTGGNFRYTILPGVPLLSRNASSFNIFGADSGCTENPNGTFSPNSSNNFLNCAAFLDPNAASLVAQRGYAFGNAPVMFSNIRGPSYINEDFSVIKRTTLSETHALVFKLDLPNAFNRHSFGSLDGNVTSGTFGVPGGGGHSVSNPPRQIQITLRYQF